MFYKKRKKTSQILGEPSIPQEHILQINKKNKNPKILTIIKTKKINNPSQQIQSKINIFKNKEPIRTDKE